MRIEVLDPATNTTRPLHPSASTMAQNITTSVTAGIAGTSAGSSAGSRGGADGITFGDEVERSSLLIIDQHTFEGNRNFEKYTRTSSLRRLGTDHFISVGVGWEFFSALEMIFIIISFILFILSSIDPMQKWLPLTSVIWSSFFNH